MSKKKIGFGIALCIAAIALSLLAATSRLNGEWLKSKLERKLEESLRGEATIESATLRPWSGEASLHGVNFLREEKDSRLAFSVGSAKAKVRVSALLFRDVEIESLEIDAPAIEYGATRPPDPEPKPTMERLKGAIREGIDKARDGAKAGAAKSETPRKPKAPDFLVERIAIRNGSARFRSTREGAEPFEAGLKRLEYSAEAVRLNSFGSLTDRASFSADIEMGGAGRMEFKGEGPSRSGVVEGVQLGYADRYLNQRDALMIKEGTMRIAQKGAEAESLLEVKVEGLKLQRNPDCPLDEFYFMPVDDLIGHVEKKNGNLDLRVRLGKGVPESSEDLDFLLGSFWDGFVAALVEEAKGILTDEAIKEGKEAVRKFFKKGNQEADEASAEPN